MPTRPRVAIALGPFRYKGTPPMTDPTLHLDPDDTVVVAGDGGFLLCTIDEETAVEIFRAWHRAAAWRFRRQIEADRRRANLRVVAGHVDRPAV